MRSCFKAGFAVVTEDISLKNGNVLDHVHVMWESKLSRTVGVCGNIYCLHMLYLGIIFPRIMQQCCGLRCNWRKKHAMADTRTSLEG